MRVVSAMLLSAILFYLSQGLSDVSTLAWFAAAPLLWLAYGDTPRIQVAGASAAAFACGQIYLFQCYGAYLPLWALAAMAGVLCVGFTGAVMISGAVWRRGWYWMALLAFPAFWTAFEYLFSAVSPHATFGTLGYAEVSFPAGMQIAALFGVHAVSFMLCLAANAVAILLRGQRRAGAAGLSVCVLVILAGAVRLALPQADHVSAAALASADAWHRESHEKTVESERDAALAYAGTVKALHGVRVVAIPEGAITLRGNEEQAVLAPLKDAAEQSGSLVVAGTIVYTPAQNRAFAFHADGTESVYAKRHLLLPLEGGTPGSDSGAIGRGYAVQICKDMDFPDSVRTTAAHGVRLMIVPANDFGRDGWIHARMSIMRGVENGFALVRSAFNGVATISDAQGRVLGSSSTEEGGMVAVTAEVPLGTGPTFYTRVGEIFSWGCVALSGLIGVSLLSRRHGLSRHTV
jgi:apolipoprotein N-acyltransferase